MAPIPTIPAEPLAVEDVIYLFPTLRQSLLSKFDDCPLSSYMETRYANGWSTHPQARGTIFHRFAAEVMRTLQANRSFTIPVQLADAILIDVCRQRDVPPEDKVRVPFREMRDLRMAARKFAADNRFTWHLIAGVEEPLAWTLTYPHPDGGLVQRTLTGTLDTLLYDGRDGAIVLDWKDTWGLPPEPKEREPGAVVGPDDEMRGISYHGYFQQRFYGWLVMKNFAHINHVTLREFYVRKTKVRKATLTRDRLPEVEEELSVLAQAFDEAIGQGAPSFPFGWFPKADPETGEVVGRELDIARLGAWKPQPGKHCGFCARARHCPIDEDTRIEVGAPPATPERAMALAAELQVIDRTRPKIITALKAYVETSGAPIPVKSAKGRLVLGWMVTRAGRRFGLYTPDASDRGGHADLDRQLQQAMREATGEARATKGVVRRRRRDAA